MKSKDGDVGPSDQLYERLKPIDDHWVLEALPDAGGQREPGPVVPAVDKAIRIMSLLNRVEGGLSLAEIARDTETTKSHCHGILKTLCRHDWLIFDGISKRYRLHAGVMRDLSSALKTQLSVEAMRPVLVRLSGIAGIASVLSRPLPDGSFLIMDSVSASRNVEISYPMGYRLPPDATAHMRANLAWRTEHEIDDWFRRETIKRYTQHTIVEQAAARTELVATRRRGYARSLEEFTEGVMAIAMPVFDATGTIAYICDCVGTLAVMRDNEARIAKAMIEAVADLHRLFGSITPPDFPRPHA